MGIAVSSLSGGKGTGWTWFGGGGPPEHSGECVCPSQPQPFMSVCLASPALGLTLAKSVPPGDPIFVSLASLLWSRHQNREPRVTDRVAQLHRYGHGH